MRIGEACVDKKERANNHGVQSGGQNAYQSPGFIWCINRRHCADLVVQVETSSSGPVTVSYEAPTIKSVLPRVLRTVGGVITITGTNFGNATYATNYTTQPPALYSWVTLQAVDGNGGIIATAAVMQCAVVTWNHTVIQCMVPPGVTLGLMVAVNVSGQYVTSPSLPLSRESRFVSYAPPAITAIVSSNGAIFPCVAGCFGGRRDAVAVLS